MNIQDILQKGGTRLDAVIDNSEYYDFELVEFTFEKIDIILDYSEFYDYTLGDNTRDYIYRETFVIIGDYLTTEDNYVLTTEDNYNILYH